MLKKIICKSRFSNDRLNCDVKSTLDHIIRNKLLVIRFKLTNIGMPKKIVIGLIVFIESVLSKLLILH